MTPKWMLAAATCVLIAACSKAPQQAPQQSSTQSPAPAGTIHEMMENLIEPSADILWDSTAVLTDAKGVHDHAPKTQQEWDKVRYSAVMLAKAMDMLAVEGVRVVPDGDQISAGGTLDAAAIQARLTANHADFARHAANLQTIAAEALKAIDARDVKRLDAAGAKIDAACEGCHLQFWYPPKADTKA